MRPLFLMVLLFACPAFAETVTVKTGEHESFTRILLQFKNLPEWKIGRTETGYELAIDGKDTRYDLSQVFRLIGRERLRSIWTDPDNGRLQLGIACACHARVDRFESSGLIIDIYDGPALPGAKTEQSLSGISMAALKATPQARPRPRPGDDGGPTYSWIEGRQQPSHVNEIPSLVETRPKLEEFRAALIDQLGRSATDGAISLTPVKQDANTSRSGDQDNRALLPGLSAGTPDPVGRKGNACISAERVDASRWGGAAAPYEELIEARQGILGEFDSLDQDRFQRLVRLYIHLGLGAEARDLIESFDQKDTVDPVLWTLTYLVDREVTDTSAFTGQQSCPGPVAMWATLALSEVGPRSGINATAAVQTFLALPAHLRATLGPDLASALRRAGLLAEAKIVAQAMSRAVDAASLQTASVAAELALDQSNVEMAQQALAEVPEDVSEVQTSLLRAELRWKRREPPSPGDLLELEAFLFQDGSGEKATEIARALATSRILSGDAAGALELVAENPINANELWSYLATDGSDALLMDAAARTTGETRDVLVKKTRKQVAERMLDLGLPLIAADWFSQISDSEAGLARIALAQGDGRKAVELLASVPPDVAQNHRIAAFVNVGAYERAAELADAAGMPDTGARLKRWARQPIPADGQDPWSDLAGLVQREDVTKKPASLAVGHDLLERAVTTRSRIKALLNATEIR